MKSDTNIETDADAGPLSKRNRIPFAVDVVTGLLFFVVARTTDLSTAAFVGLGVGVALLLFQRITRIDVTGGLALFGIAMMALSAGLAWWLADEEWVKLRGTFVGLIAATLFIGDGLMGGRRLSSALARYLPYTDLDLGRLGVGVGLAGAIMALLNLVVARAVSTDLWLLYTTFLDTFVSIALFLLAVSYARRRWMFS